MRVLLVEHDVTATRGMRFFLRGRNVVVDTTDTGEEALDLLKHDDYDGVLLELMLPDRDGYQVLRHRRAARQRMAVLNLSGLTRPEAKVTAVNLGADDDIAKPPRPAQGEGANQRGVLEPSLSRTATQASMASAAA
jgi:two-component system cell cycle response regulator CtrA